MWNRIDPLIQPITRRVEESNSRMELRKDESENYGGERKRGGSEEIQAMPWEDTTIVSTLALANFLSALLGGPQQTVSGEGLPSQPSPVAEHHDPANTYISRATHAYQATGRAVHDQNVGEPAQAPIDTATAVTLGSDFGEDDLARIREFILDLQNLELNGVKEIILQRTLAFLDAIEQGIADARAGSK